MQIVVLQRIAQSQLGTFGNLVREEIPLCGTCEDPWAGNQVGMSCIPEGVYPVAKYSSPKFTDVWQVKNVPGRDKILIHAGNSIADTSGCILVGRSFRTLRDDAGHRMPIVTDSHLTLELLRKILPSEFMLKVLNPKTKIGD